MIIIKIGKKEGAREKERESTEAADDRVGISLSLVSRGRPFSMQLSVGDLCSFV